MSCRLADPELAERWRATQRRWRELIEARLERLQGAEVEILAGVAEDETHTSKPLRPARR